MAAGLPRDCLILDPGFGFGKNLEHNLELLRRLDVLVATGFPVLAGLSRKSMLGDLLGRAVEDGSPAVLRWLSRPGSAEQGSSGCMMLRRLQMRSARWMQLKVRYRQPDKRP